MNIMQISLCYFGRRLRSWGATEVAGWAQGGGGGAPALWAAALPSLRPRPLNHRPQEQLRKAKTRAHATRYK